MLLQGFEEAGPGDEAQGVIQTDPSAFSVGTGAQFEDGNDAAEVVGGGCIGGHGKCVSEAWRTGWPVELYVLRADLFIRWSSSIAVGQVSLFLLPTRVRVESRGLPCSGLLVV